VSLVPLPATLESPCASLATGGMLEGLVDIEPGRNAPLSDSDSDMGSEVSATPPLFGGKDSYDCFPDITTNIQY